jgi:DNA-binding transcriptional ArsR family regulator
MRTASPPLLPLFRSRGQARLLARLYLGDPKPVPMRELARELGLAPSRVHSEVQRLEDAGLIVSDRVGKQRLVRPNERSPFYPELRGLLLKAFGPGTILEPLIAEIPGIEDAFIYGSWARRYAGEAGITPEDVDLMVIGEPAVEKVYAAADRASRELGREVAVTILSPTEWKADSGFTTAVRSGARVPLRVRQDASDA